MSDEVVYKAQEKAKLAKIGDPNGRWLVAGGLGLLALTLSGVSMLELLAPLVFISGIGALLMWPAHKATADEPTNWSFLAGPGAFMLLLGGLVFFANAFDHPELFSYGWTLFPMSFIAGLMYARRFDENHPIHQRGAKAIRVFGWLLVGLGLFFELIVFETLGPWWPLAIIGYGVYMLMKKGQRAQNNVAA